MSIVTRSSYENVHHSLRKVCSSGVMATFDAPAFGTPVCSLKLHYLHFAPKCQDQLTHTSTIKSAAGYCAKRPEAASRDR